MASQQTKIQHLFLRAAFGETPQRIQASLNIPLNSLVDSLFDASKDFKDIDYIPYPLKENQEESGVGVGQFVMMLLKSKQDTEELNGEWIFKMTNTKAVLREKMTFFWHNHFATSYPLAYLTQVQNNTIRKYALGKFSDLLHAISKDQLMILYLNNQENKKNHPNENFAREVMELFTLGEGHYTEKDIKEAARAFTGWTVNKMGEFEFQEKHHDTNEKEVLGKKGNFKGDDIINILLEQKQTAKYIVSKLYREFVNPELKPERVNKLAEDFFNSGYDISALMKSIFTSDWFYDDENIGVKIASPVELIVRYKKMIAIEFKKEKAMVNLQKALGQVLFFPPNVAGWKGGANWIDSSSLLLRLNIPEYIVTGTEMSLKAKPAFEEKSDDNGEKLKGGKVESDWTALVKSFENVPEKDLEDVLIKSLIQCDAGRINKELVRINTGGSKEKNIIRMAANIMSLPEFQLI